MRKYILSFVIVSFMVIAGVRASSPPAEPARVSIATVQQAPLLIRTVTANDTMLDNDTKTWANCSANGKEIPQNWSWLNLSLYAHDTNGVSDGNTGTVYIYGCEDQTGMRLVAYGNFTIGTIQLSHDPISGDTLNSAGTADPNYCWMDTYTALDSGIWARPVIASGAGGADPNGNIASIWFDRFNLYKIWVDVNNVTFGAEAGVDSITVIMNGGT